MKIPYTGCNPHGLILARGEDLSKTLVHNVPIIRCAARYDKLITPVCCFAF